ncbi:hypothetical protein Pelo_8654 [Pelomyxa schiedti]|nr:hypothetical protein Pelo_8654 [Pelomyxa schiedti]
MATIDKKKKFKGPLWEYSAKGDAKKLKKLLEKGNVNVNEFDEERKTPLHWAAEYGHVAIAELLFGRGANLDITFKSPGGETPLHVALHNKQEAVALFLSKSGARVDLENASGQTANSLVASMDKRFVQQFKESRPKASYYGSTKPLVATSPASPTPTSTTSPTPSPSTSTTPASTPTPAPASSTTATTTPSSQTPTQSNVSLNTPAATSTATPTKPSATIDRVTVVTAASIAASSTLRAAYRSDVEDRMRVLNTRLKLEETVWKLLEYWDPLPVEVVDQQGPMEDEIANKKKEVEKELAALLITQFRSWFEPDVASVDTAKFDACQIQVTPLIPIDTEAKSFHEYSSAVIKWVNSTSGFMGGQFKFKLFSAAFAETNRAVQGLLDLVGKKGPIADSVLTLQERLKNIGTKLNGIILSGDATVLVLPYVSTIGASYWSYACNFRRGVPEVYDSMKNFVTSVCNLGVGPGSDVDLLKQTLKFYELITCIAFNTKLPDASIMISNSNFGVGVCVRALISTHVQGLPKDSQVMQLLAQHLEELKDTVLASIYSQSGPDLSHKEEEEILSSGMNLLQESTVFYSTALSNPEHLAIVQSVSDIVGTLTNLINSLHRCPPIADYSIELDEMLFPWEAIPSVEGLNEKISALCVSLQQNKMLSCCIRLFRLTSSQISLALSTILAHNNIYCNVGKTSLLDRFWDDTFYVEHPTRTAAGFERTFGDVTLYLFEQTDRTWDIDYRDEATLNADLILQVYDLADPVPASCLQKDIYDCRCPAQPMFLVVGNKQDLSSTVPEDIVELCHKIGIEPLTCSAKDGTGVSELWSAITTQMKQRNAAPSNVVIATKTEPRPKTSQIVTIGLFCASSFAFMEDICMLPGGGYRNLYQLAFDAGCKPGMRTVPCLRAVSQAAMFPPSCCVGTIHYLASYMMAQALGMKAEYAYQLAIYSSATDLPQFIPCDACGNGLPANLRSPPMFGMRRLNMSTSGYQHHMPLTFEGHYGNGLNPNVFDHVNEGFVASWRDWAFAPAPGESNHGHYQQHHQGCLFGITIPHQQNVFSGPNCPQNGYVNSTLAMFLTGNLTVNRLTMANIFLNNPTMVANVRTVVDVINNLGEMNLHDTFTVNQIPQWLETFPEYSIMSDGNQVPEAIVKYGVYLHALGDRVSHWYCSDSVGTNMVKIQDQPEDVYAAIYNATMCNTGIHTLQHFWEIGHAPNAQQTYSVIPVMWQEMSLWTSEMRFRFPDWFDDHLVLSTTVLSALQQLVNIKDAGLRMDYFLSKLALFGMETLPGFPNYSTACSA